MKTKRKLDPRWRAIQDRAADAARATRDHRVTYRLMVMAEPAPQLVAIAHRVMFGRSAP